MNTTDDVGKAAISTVAQLGASVYSDLASPAVRRTGAALDTVFKIGLSPVALLDWGFERTREWLAAKLVQRLDATPEDCRQEPPTHLAAPLLLAISTAADCEDLRNLYAELLMKSADKRTVSQVHPSYASVLGQLTPQEALVLIGFRSRQSHSIFIDNPRKYRVGAHTIEDQFHQHCLALGLQDPSSDVWLQNMLRLRLLDLTVYTDAVFQSGESEFGKSEPSIETKDERHLSLTDYGGAFIEACAPPSNGAA